MARGDPTTRRVFTTLEKRLVDGRYRVKKALGRGGMARVYLVTDESTGRELALKQLGGPSADRTSRHDRLRFRREFHTMAGLRHPRVVEVHDFGEDDLGPYYTMEHLDGEDLRDVRPVPWDRACALLRDVALALAFLHVRGLVHRDLAPRNVRCTADGRAKLIDFGVLATVGVVADPAGTAPYIAPENLRGIPIDHRADLFGLGALAYWLLTGRTAFRARKLSELEGVWRRRPPAPSQLAEELPKGVDDLVMSLLSLTPHGRPPASDVIDALTSLASLRPVSDEELVQGHLASAALVGREAEMARVRRAVEKANAEQRGTAVVIFGPSGMGKSRLMRELGLEAQVAGATVVSARAQSADQGPYGLVRELGRAMLVAAPADAAEAARSHARVIVRAVPELAEHLGPVPVAPVGRDPGEQRMLLQAELCEWFLELAHKRTLVLLVDDVQRADEASAAVLASLAHSARRVPLVLVVTRRTDEKDRARTAVDKLADVAMRIKLRGLDATDLEQLVTAVFGPVGNVRRLADFLARGGGGSPLHSVEMLKGLMDSGAIQPFHGSWVITDAWDEQTLPPGLAQMLDERVARLSPATRALAEVLAVHGGELPLELCVSLADTTGSDTVTVFDALDELTEAEVLIGTAEAFRFRHDGFREAVLRSIDDEGRRALHRRIGQTLLERGEVPKEREADVGWHLLNGGNEQDGARLLLSAGRRLYLSQSFTEAREPLEAALKVYSDDPAGHVLTAEVRQMLLLAGCMTDRDVALRYADAAIEGLYRLSGLALASRLRRYLGRFLGLVVGVGVACVKWVSRFRGPRGPNPIWALENVFVSVGFAASMHSVSWNVPAIKRLIHMVDPLKVFGDTNPYAVYLLTENLLYFPLGMFRTIRDNTRKILDILATTDGILFRLTPISDLDLRVGEAGARFMNALIAVSEQDSSYEEEIRAIDKLELRFFELGALQARIAFHRCRGEEPTAVELERMAEILLVRLGSAWQMEAWLAVVSSFAYGLTRDALGLKRTITRLEALIEHGFHFDAALALARGEYHRERRELDASVNELERALELAGDDLRLVRLPALAALAETLLARGDLDRALETALRAVAEATDPETGQPVNRLRSLRALALVRAAAGDRARAERRLDAAIEEARAMGSPSVLGSLHEARATLAMDVGDDVALRWHASETARWYLPTENQVLVARAQRLSARVERRETGAAPSGESDDTATVVDVVTAATVPERSELLSGCRGRGERADRTLAILVEAARAERGFLYLLRGDAIELESPRVGREPPMDVAERLGMLVEAALSDALEDQQTLADSFRSLGTDTAHQFQPLLLVAQSGQRRLVVGAVALVGDSLRVPDPALVSGLSRALYEAGDVSTRGAVGEGST